MFTQYIIESVDYVIDLSWTKMNKLKIGSD